MFKATKRTLTAAAVIVAASGPSAAHAGLDLNPSPRGVAIVLAQAQPASSGVRSNSDQQMPQTSDPGAAHSVSAASIPRCPRVGPCISPYTVVTHESAPASVTGLAALNHEQAVAEKALVANLVGRNHASEASRLTATRAPVAATVGGGFDWGDGAIGALAVLGMMAAGFGATVLVRRWTGSLARTES
jgi:hypothetical protein